MKSPPTLTRRQLLAGAGSVAAVAALGACTSAAPARATEVGPSSPAVAAAESRRRAAGARTIEATLVARPARIDLGGPVVATWAYGDRIPGRLLRAKVGEVLKVTVQNGLPEDTSVHWHGLALRNDMDGVPGVTQQPIRPRGSMAYEFALPHPGTYWFHPHVGTQLDRGLYAPLVVEDPDDAGQYDTEFTVVLDDWLDGTGRTPDTVSAELRKGGGMAGMDMGMGGMSMPHMPRSDALAGDAGDVTYPCTWSTDASAQRR